MREAEHIQALERMYLAEPNNAYYQPEAKFEKGRTEITIELRYDFFHSAGGVHGSVYFKLLDDAAFFAANTLETEVFLLTNTFNTYLTRPVSNGVMRAVGTVVNQNRSQFVAESVVYNSGNQEIGRGSGLFVRSKIPLEKTLNYLA
tara:strand:- start:2414 stop:2851 length:438 start_codon:yes stop_codon:yes gene_type:complete